MAPTQATTSKNCAISNAARAKKSGHPLQLAHRLVDLGAPVLEGVLGHRLVVPGVRADRHARLVQRADLPAGEPARLVEHDGHDEEGRDEVVAPQDRQRGRVLAGGRVVEGEQDGLGGELLPARDVGHQLVAGQSRVAGVVQRRHLPCEDARRDDVGPGLRPIGARRRTDLVVAEHRDVRPGRDRGEIRARSGGALGAVARRLASDPPQPAASSTHRTTARRSMRVLKQQPLGRARARRRASRA